MPSFASPPLDAVPAALIWRIYRISRRSDGCDYVGVTSRTLAVRAAAHAYLARRHPQRGRPGTLVAAIRAALDQGLSFAEAFAVEELEVTTSPEVARALERSWIARLGTAWPRGFNRQPGGASLGGPANATPVTLRHPRRGPVRYPSVLAAIADIDRERHADGQPPLSIGLVYARQALGWSLEEALDLQPHQDGRGQRGDVWWNGQQAASLRVVSQAQGIRLETLRSRLHRARRQACMTMPDLAQDRRHSASRRVAGKAARPQPFVLPHPIDPRGLAVNAAVFARLAGLPRATVLHRYHDLIARHGNDMALPRATVLRMLVRRRCREIRIDLLLPDGRKLSGGVRALIRQVLADPRLAEGRPERLGQSAIRARLRRLPGWPRPLSTEGIAWAFGFQPKAAPEHDEPPGCPGPCGPAGRRP